MLVFRFTVRACCFFPSAAVLINDTESFIFSHPPSCHIWKTSIAHIWQIVCEHLIQIIVRQRQMLAHATCLLKYYSQWLSDEGIYPAPLPTFPTPFTGEDTKRRGETCEMLYKTRGIIWHLNQLVLPLKPTLSPLYHNQYFWK